jgi:hypothetical protein
LVGEGEVLVISMPGRKVLECHSGLRPSEKELPEWRSGTFHHKNTPVCIYCCYNQLWKSIADDRDM